VSADTFVSECVSTLFRLRLQQLLLISLSVHRQSSVGCLIVDDVALDLLAVAEDVTVLLDWTGVLPLCFCSVPNSRWKILFTRFFSFLFWQLPCIS